MNRFYKILSTLMIFFMIVALFTPNIVKATGETDSSSTEQISYDKLFAENTKVVLGFENQQATIEKDKTFSETILNGESGFKLQINTDISLSGPTIEKGNTYKIEIKPETESQYLQINEDTVSIEFGGQPSIGNIISKNNNDGTIDVTYKFNENYKTATKIKVERDLPIKINSEQVKAYFSENTSDTEFKVTYDIKINDESVSKLELTFNKKSKELKKNPRKTEGGTHDYNKREIYYNILIPTALDPGSNHYEIYDTPDKFQIIEEVNVYDTCGDELNSDYLLKPSPTVEYFITEICGPNEDKFSAIDCAVYQKKEIDQTKSYLSPKIVKVDDELFHDLQKCKEILEREKYKNCGMGVKITIDDYDTKIKDKQILTDNELTGYLKVYVRTKVKNFDKNLTYHNMASMYAYEKPECQEESEECRPVKYETLGINASNDSKSNDAYKVGELKPDLKVSIEFEGYKYNKIKIVKTDENDKPLKGAKFKFTAGENTAKILFFNEGELKYELIDDYVLVSSIDENNNPSIDIQRSNNDLIKNVKDIYLQRSTTSYKLVEIAAPGGYEQVEPIEVKADETTKDITYEIKVKNKKKAASTETPEQPDSNKDTSGSDNTIDVATNVEVRFHGEGGVPVLQVEKVKPGNKVNPDYIVEPFRAGYEFEGWYYKNGEHFNFDKPIYISTDVYAKWKKTSIVIPIVEDKKPVPNTADC